MMSSVDSLCAQSSYNEQGLPSKLNGGDSYGTKAALLGREKKKKKKKTRGKMKPARRKRYEKGRCNSRQTW
jgi:hypothetical protein